MSHVCSLIYSQHGFDVDDDDDDDVNSVFGKRNENKWMPLFHLSTATNIPSLSFLFCRGRGGGLGKNPSCCSTLFIAAAAGEVKVAAEAAQNESSRERERKWFSRLESLSRVWKVRRLNYQVLDDSNIRSKKRQRFALTYLLGIKYLFRWVHFNNQIEQEIHVSACL